MEAGDASTPTLSQLPWTQWARNWTPKDAGTYRILCRATDGFGTLQDARERAPHPSGASGHHYVEVLAV